MNRILKVVIWIYCVTVFGVAILLMGRIVLPRWNVSLGDMEWIYLGNNMSEIRFGCCILAGPCQMEIKEVDDVVYGNSNDDFPWFVIDKRSHRILKGDSLDEICSEMGVPRPNGNFKLETFLTRWNAINER